MNSFELVSAFKSEWDPKILLWISNGFRLQYQRALTAYKDLRDETRRNGLSNHRNDLINDYFSKVPNQFSNISGEYRPNTRSHFYPILKSPTFLMTITRYQDESAHGKHANFRDNLIQYELFEDYSLSLEDSKFIYIDLEFGEYSLFATEPAFINLNFKSHNIKLSLREVILEGIISGEQEEPTKTTSGHPAPILRNLVDRDKKENSGSEVTKCKNNSTGSA